MVLKNEREMFHVMKVNINNHPSSVDMEVSQCGSCRGGVRYFFCIGAVALDTSHNLSNIDE